MEWLSDARGTDSSLIFAWVIEVAHGLPNALIIESGRVDFAELSRVPIIVTLDGYSLRCMVPDDKPQDVITAFAKRMGWEVEPAEETPCPARGDKKHCVHWYDGEMCCGCNDGFDRANDPSEFRVDTMSPGTSICVTHIPTGIVESCDEFPSQFRNRQQAMKRVCVRISARLMDGDPASPVGEKSDE